MYLVLSQQKFSPGTGSCHSARVVYYGDLLYLAEDLTHFIYRGYKCNIRYLYYEETMGQLQSSARSARRGLVNSYIKKYIYDIDTPSKLYFVIIQTKDVNTYLHNKYEFNYVTFGGMRFEMVIKGSGTF